LELSVLLDASRWKKQYDFSKGQRGKFYRAGAELSHPQILGCLNAAAAQVVREQATQERTNVRL